MGGVSFADMMDDESEATPVVAPQKPKIEKPKSTERDIKVPPKVSSNIPDKISPKISTEISSKISSPVTDQDYDYSVAVRKALRAIGNTPMPLRTTPVESDRLKAIVRAYEDQGILTDRTQIIRGLLNVGLDDWERNGENSIIHKFLMEIHVN